MWSNATLQFKKILTEILMLFKIYYHKYWYDLMEISINIGNIYTNIIYKGPSFKSYDFLLEINIILCDHSCSIP